MSLAKFPIPLQDQLSVTSISQRTTFVTKTNVMGSMQSMYTFFHICRKSDFSLNMNGI